MTAIAFEVEEEEEEVVVGRSSAVEVYPNLQRTTNPSFLLAQNKVSC